MRQSRTSLLNLGAKCKWYCPSLALELALYKLLNLCNSCKFATIGCKMSSSNDIPSFLWCILCLICGLNFRICVAMAKWFQHCRQSNNSCDLWTFSQTLRLQIVFILTRVFLTLGSLSTIFGFQKFLWFAASRFFLPFKDRWCKNIRHGHATRGLIQ